MGLLSEGTALSWHASARYRKKVKSDGIDQFLHVFHIAKHFKDYHLRWGDEVEYFLLHLDRQNKKVTLSLRAPALLEILQLEENSRTPSPTLPVLWRPEYASWMIEAIPGVPYREYAADLVNVHRNMALRRTELTKLLDTNEAVATLTAFPLVGCGNFTTPPSEPFGPVARSFFTSDDTISTHQRFRTLTSNIRERRGRKVHIEVPLFIDENTQVYQPLIPQNHEHLTLLGSVSERLVTQGKTNDPDYAMLEEALQTNVDGKVIMDSASFGMGNSCLQVTIQGRDLAETRFLYDQLAVVAPLMLALTASTPALRGLLADTDVRWAVISAAMDDRTEEEMKNNRIPKSRYSSIDSYISCKEEYKPEKYNDVDIPIDGEAYKRLRSGGVDHLLAQHIAHLFIRDPLVIYEGKVNLDNTASTDHFENIQSTNWNTVRFKLPPPGVDIGWRVEFRTMEIGLTDFENAAFSVFIVILSRVILAYNLNFYIPMSKVDKNMDTAHKRDAVRTERFYFRKTVCDMPDGFGFLEKTATSGGCGFPGNQKSGLENGDAASRSSAFEMDCEEMSLDEIFNGKAERRNGTSKEILFPGLIPLMRGYLNNLDIDDLTRGQLLSYLDFVGDRAAGEIPTMARYMRSFLTGHAAYRSDSVVNEEMCFDLVAHLQNIGEGHNGCAGFLGKYAKQVRLQDPDTPSSMMARMQKEFEGLEGGLLQRTLPHSVVKSTLDEFALS